MNEILASNYFKDFIVPLSTVLLTVTIKVFSRKDKFIRPTLDDFAIGFDLTISSLLLLIFYAAKLAQDIKAKSFIDQNICSRRLEVIPWILVVELFLILIMIHFVRIWGWRDDTTKTLKLWQGVMIPNLFGVSQLFITVKLMG